VAARNRDFSDAAVGAAGLGAELINMRHGREAELESDYYGMQYMSRAGYDPRAAITLQETFVRLSEGRDTGGWLSGLFASHPPSAERVAANRATAAQLPPTGTLGTEAYMNATANLRRDAPGFEAIDNAREALANNDLAGARREAQIAVDRMPNDADVEALLGDIEMAANRPGAALPRYTRAVELNDRFFYFDLAKGNAHLALDQLPAAQSAYEASLRLLPTAGAYLGLGRIAEARGDIAGALEQYSRAAESSGQAGADARAAAIRLDLPMNPDRYLVLAVGLDTNGRLLIDIGNATEYEIGGIAVSISYIEGGQARLVRRTLDGTLTPGNGRRYATGLGPFTTNTAYQVVIDTARVIAAP
jgi:predicted Zn-dependent protease